MIAYCKLYLDLQVQNDKLVQISATLGGKRKIPFHLRIKTISAPYQAKGKIRRPFFYNPRYC